MAGTNQYSNYPVAFNGTWNLTQLLTGSYDSGASEDEIVPSGDYKRAAIITNSLSPTLSLETTDLSTVLTNLTSIKEGYACSSGADIYFRQRSQGAIFESGSSAFRLQSRKGHLILDSISCQGVGPATASLVYHDLWDGTNNMSAPSAASALGASTPAFVSQYYRGTATVNGTAIDNITGVNVSFGLMVDKEIYSGNHGPTQLCIAQVLPVIEITTADLAEFASKVTNSHGATYTTLVVYFRAGTAGGLRGGAGTALSITSSSGKMIVPNIQGGGVGNSSMPIRFMPTTDMSFSLSATHP